MFTLSLTKVFTLYDNNLSVFLLPSVKFTDSALVFFSVFFSLVSFTDTLDFLLGGGVDSAKSSLKDK